MLGGFGTAHRPDLNSAKWQGRAMRRAEYTVEEIHLIRDDWAAQVQCCVRDPTSCWHGEDLSTVRPLCRQRSGERHTDRCGACSVRKLKTTRCCAEKNEAVR